ncbi:MAG: hypothetical protein ACI9QV_000659 [Methylophagaceae bacterium]|jgi:hypothetical protein
MKKIILLASALLLSAQAQAAIVSVSGGNGVVINAVSVQEDGRTNTFQEGFNEQQGVVLSSAVSIDGSTNIAAGTRVDSHLIFLNTDGGTQGYDKNLWTFSGDILGVMSNTSGTLLMNSNNQLAAFADYFTAGSVGPFNALGLEQNNINGTQDGYLVSGATLDLAMYVTEPGDWIRVVTVSEVPVPAALFLFAPALLGFLGLRKKSKLAA